MFAVDITVRNFRCFEDSDPLKLRLQPGFTAIVGPNNSGKSTVLKFFYEFRSLFTQLTSTSSPTLEAFRGKSQTFDRATSLFDPLEQFSYRNTRNIELQFDFLNAPQSPDGIRLDHLLITIPRARNLWTAEVVHSQGSLDGRAVEDWSGDNLRLAGSRLLNMGPLLETFRALAGTLYIGPFRNAINVGSAEDYFDIRCGQSFIREWRARKHGNSIQEADAIYRATSDIRRIFGFDGLDIDSSSDEQTLDVTIDGRRHKLPEIGSGLTQFILVLGNAAVKKPSLILIDEPELNLHPTLQLDFLTSLASYAAEGVIFGTHSYGLARSAADRILTTRLLEPGLSEVRTFETTQRLSELLGEMSFSGYQELGFDRVLLVEGRHDVKTVQQFLRHLGKDHQVVLLPLGGSSLVTGKAEEELAELLRISPRISALIDSEKSSKSAKLDTDREDFVEVCERLSIDCHVLERRAIEHYLSDRAIKMTKGEKYRALTMFEQRESVEPVWGKHENWQIAREMTTDEFIHTDLGAFLGRL